MDFGSVWWMWLFVPSVFLSAAAGQFAFKKGRSFWGFFFLSLFFTPILGFIVAAVLGETADAVHLRRQEWGLVGPCPQCKGMVERGAQVCPHCGMRF
jgi:hypothetical protein